MATAKQKKISQADVESLELEEAVSIRSILDDHISQLQEQQKAGILEQVKGLLGSAGLDPSVLKQLIPASGDASEEPKTRKKIGKVPNKYQITDPETDEIIRWSGRGICPRRIAKILEQINITVSEFKEDPQYQIGNIDDSDE